ncbi:gluconokinase-like isoform X1 [Physcomitrium patens]|uniref:gluconokinase n=1 Tax=Physcomitrium patens TaxID=3218 RepID=A0A7I4DUH2_PHYPA|nr:gluconokinase-like [Physcomitrium patens]XP_024374928.1 gluconokinase-like [Physcomitrium patens]XP_024374929.1 gluconokinase-like [Physcomitrium patens]XP_024374930.1 gluconokinase-like [Physcomitrium patens]|eukprot:XP_024374927.1 gluconokinase-like [Physcomitrella patens]
MSRELDNRKLRGVRLCSGHCVREMMAGKAIIVMGTSGAGKSTVGRLLAAELRCEFLDADNFHSAQNKEKMSRGVALTDEDRMPWLETLRDTLIDYIIRGQCVVLACSALQPHYRDLLRTADYEFLLNETTPEPVSTPTSNDINHQHRRQGKSLSSLVVFVYLKATVGVLSARLAVRDIAGTHYAHASLLQSQIDALQFEADERDIMDVDAALPPAQIVRNIQKQLQV